MLLRSFILLLVVTTSARASECVVSSWSSWGDCIGSCHYAEAVRNRDVLKPPLPETISSGGSFRKVCPILYETQICVPRHCIQIEDDMPRPSPFMLEDLEQPSTINTTIPSEQSKQDTEAAINVKTEQLGHVSTIDDNDEIPLPSSLSEEQNPTDTDEGTDESFLNSNDLLPMSSGASEIVDRSSEDIPAIVETTTSSTTSTTTTPLPTTTSQSLRRIEVTSEPHNNQEFFVNRLTIDMPLRKLMSTDVEKKLQRRLNISKIHYKNLGTTSAPSHPKPLVQASAVPIATDPPVEQVLSELEAAGDLNNPWDDKNIRKAIRKNKKLMKALVEAYRYRQSTATSTSSLNEQVADSLPIEQTTSTTTESTTTTTTTEATTPTQIQYWKHQPGFVPNTKKHASDITNKLYMTREIIQALSDDIVRRPPILHLECLENSRCCKVERKICPDGTRPTMVRRFYRPAGSSICVPYHYPKCSQTEEMEERPIEYAQNCQDLCFAGPEKRISPLVSSDFHHIN